MEILRTAWLWLSVGYLSIKLQHASGRSSLPHRATCVAADIGGIKQEPGWERGAASGGSSRPPTFAEERY